MTEDKFIQIISKTWAQIRCDLPEDMTKAEMIEVVLDADYLELYHQQDKATVTAFRALSYTDQEALAAKAVR